MNWSRSDETVLWSSLTSSVRTKIYSFVQKWIALILNHDFNIYLFRNTAWKKLYFWKLAFETVLVISLSQLNNWSWWSAFHRMVTLNPGMRQRFNSDHAVIFNVRYITEATSETKLHTTKIAESWYWKLFLENHSLNYRSWWPIVTPSPKLVAEVQFDLFVIFNVKHIT